MFSRNKECLRSRSKTQRKGFDHQHFRWVFSLSADEGVFHADLLTNFCAQRRTAIRKLARNPSNIAATSTPLVLARAMTKANASLNPLPTRINPNTTSKFASPAYSTPMVHIWRSRTAVLCPTSSPRRSKAVHSLYMGMGVRRDASNSPRTAQEGWSR